MDADDDLLGDRRDVGRASAGRRAARGARRGCSGRRRATISGVIASAIERELPARTKKSTAVTTTIVSDVLEEEDQAVAEEEAHGLQVDRRARHQLAGLVAVVEAEREPEEVRVELVAHVVLDAERLPAGDQAPADHEQRLARARAATIARDLEDEQLRVRLAVELVDHDAGQHGHEDRRDLRERPRAATRRRATRGTGAGSRAGGRTCASPLSGVLRGSSSGTAS